jgi:hypothetical protein
MAIGRPEAIDAAPARGRSTAEDGGGETFLPREEWALAQGKKVDPTPLRLRRSRRSRPLARSAKREAARFARTEQHPQEKTWRMPVSLLKGDSALGEEKEAMA